MGSYPVAEKVLKNGGKKNIMLHFSSNRLIQQTGHFVSPVPRTLKK